MKNTILLVTILLLAGCGKMSRITATISGHSFECVDGISYLQFTSGVTVAYNKDGTIRTCGE